MALEETDEQVGIRPVEETDADVGIVPADTGIGSLPGHMIGGIRNIPSDIADVFMSGAKAFLLKSPKSDYADVQPNIHQKFIDAGDLPEVAQRKTADLINSLQQQEARLAPIWGYMQMLISIPWGMQRALFSRPIEESGGFPIETTETLIMAGLGAAGLRASGRLVEGPSKPITEKPRITGGPDDALDMAVARDLGVVGPERPPITEGTPVEAAHNVIQPIEAYHGSPYSFDAFSLEKIGTGEGAQSYGHGLYLAESQSVAETYKSAGANRGVDAKFKVVKDGKVVEGGIADENYAATRAKEVGGEYEMEHGGNANIYRTRIHADREHFLDWDKPLSEQPENVRASLAKLGIKDPAMSGADAYHEITRAAAERKYGGRDDLGTDVKRPDASYEYTPADTSNALRDAGIPGIKYLDQGSRIIDPPSEPLSKLIDNRHEMDVIRATPEAERTKVQLDRYDELHADNERIHREIEAHEKAQQTSNFVVFDDKLIEITHKNDVPVQPPAPPSKPPTPPGGGEPPRKEGAATDKAGNIRLDLITTHDDAKNIIRAAAEEVGGPDAFMEARRGEIPLAQHEALSQATGIPVADLDIRGMGRLMKNDNEVRIAIQAMIQSAEDTSAAMKKAALTDLPEDLIEFQRLRMRHSVLQEQVSGLTAEWGRTGNVFQEFAERAKDAKGLGEFLKDKKGETIEDLREMAKAGSVLDRGELAKFLNEARREPPSLLFWTWVNGLISGLHTHTKYAAANSFYAGMERGVVTPFAALISKAKEMGGAETDRVFFGETVAGMWGMLAATPGSLLATAKSIKAGVRAPLESEVLLREAKIARGEKVDATLERANNPLMMMQRPTHWRIPIYDKFKGNEPREINQVYGRIVGAPGDAAMGIHTFFKIIGERAGIETEAYAAAAKEGLSPTSPEFWERRAYHAANPTETMMERAVESAYKGTFMQELGPHGRMWQQFTKQTPGLKWIFPFSHIPVNLMKATYEYTPFAFLDSQMRDTITGKNGGAAQDKAIARMVVGSAIMGYFTNLYMTGRATGDYPHDPKERDAWKLQGKMPNSVLIGDYWVSFERFGPAGSLASLGANIGDVIHTLKKEDDDAMTKATWHAAAAAGHIVINEVGFMSLQKLFEAIADEKKGAAWAASTAGSAIPFSSLVGQTASGGIPFSGFLGDPYMREAKTFVDGLKYRIPGLRETLLPKRDWSGVPIDNPQYANVIRQRRVNTDPVDMEMMALGIHPAPPDNKIGGVKLTPQMYDIYQSTAGAMTRHSLEDWVTQPGWHDLPVFVRETMFKGTISATRAAAAASMQARYPQIIQQGIENRVNHITGQKPTTLRE